MEEYWAFEAVGKACIRDPRPQDFFPFVIIVALRLFSKGFT
jgi:hypothetical protein